MFKLEIGSVHKKGTDTVEHTLLLLPAWWVYVIHDGFLLSLLGWNSIKHNELNPIKVGSHPLVCGVDPWNGFMIM